MRQKRHAVQSGPQSGAANQGVAQVKRQVIRAMLKGQVQLNCNISPAEQDDAVSLVLWYKDKSTVPIYRSVSSPSLSSKSIPNFLKTNNYKFVGSKLINQS